MFTKFKNQILIILSAVLASLLILAGAFIFAPEKPAYADEGGESTDLYWGIDDAGVLTLSSVQGDTTPTQYAFNTTIPNWLSDDSNLEKITSVTVSGSVTAPQSMQNWFCNLINLTNVELTGLNTSSVTDMSFMFQHCDSLTKLSLPNFNTSSVTTMKSLFRNCAALTSLDLSSFDTSSVTDMQYMFNGCSNLNKITVSSSLAQNLYATSTNTYLYSTPHDTWFGADGNAYTGENRFSQEGTYTTSQPIFKVTVGEATTNYGTIGEAFSAANTAGTATVTMYADAEISSALIVSANVTLDLNGNMLKMAEGCNDSVIYIMGIGTFTLEDSGDGGVITGGSGSAGGGVCGDEGSTFKMHGGTISGNTANFGGGVYICSGTFEVSGAVNITGNTNSGAENNVYLEDVTITVVGALTDGAQIGINNAGEVATGFTQEGNPADFFIPDNETNNCIYLSDEESGTVTIGTHAMEWSYDDENHWQECNNCGETDGEAAHSFANGECECGKEAELYWGIDADGVLTLSSYKTDVTPKNYSDENWHGYQPTRNKIKSVTVDTYAYAPASMYNWFWNCTNLSTVNLSGLDTSRVTTMEQLFADCGKLSSVNLDGLVTASVEKMNSLVRGCALLTDIDLSSFDTSNVTDMNNMFSGCSGLSSLDLSNFDISKVEQMGSMFADCSSLEALDISSFSNAEKLRGIGGMFSGCTSLTTIDLSDFDTSHAVYMGNMFSGCTGLTTLDLSSFDTSNVSDMNQMFSGCTGLTSLDFSQFPYFNTSKVTDMSYMFSGCIGLTSLNLSSFDTSEVTTTFCMFDSCISLTSLTLTGWDTGELKSMSYMFSGCSSLTSLNLSSFDTTKVTDAEDIFEECSSLNEIHTPKTIVKALPLPDATSLWWNEARETIITGTITSDDEGNTIYLHEHTWKQDWSYDDETHWHECICGEKQDDEETHTFSGGECTVCHYDASDLYWAIKTEDNEVKLILSYYQIDSGFQKYDFDTNWSDSNSAITSVSVDTYAYAPVSLLGWFMSCTNLQSADLSGLDTSRVTVMSEMFRGCSSLTSLNLSSFDTAKVTSMSNMFTNCNSLTSLDLTSFNTEKVTTMMSMFRFCGELTALDLSSFNAISVTNAGSMFLDCDKLNTIISPTTVGDTALPLPCKFKYEAENGDYTYKSVTSITGAVEGKTLTRHATCTPGEEVTENEVAATCTATGSYDSVVYCTDCGDEISRTAVTVDKIPHSYDENGVCTACGDVAPFVIIDENDEITGYYYTLNAAVNVATDNVTVKMLADAQTVGIAYIFDVNITFDLNGHNLLCEGNSHTIIMLYNAELILCDSSEEGNGSIGGGYHGVQVENSSFIMTGGTISGNHAIMGGGVYVRDGGSFEMKGGTISGNTADDSGGGVFFDGGSFKMSGGTISGNTADTCGGGVCINGGSFEMKGGTISGNTVTNNSGLGGGVYFVSDADENFVIADESKFVMSGGSINGNESQLAGGVCVLGNFEMSDGEINDNTGVYGAGGVLLVLGTFEISGGTIIGNKQTENLQFEDIDFGYCGGVCVGHELLQFDEIETTLKISGNPVITGNKVTIDGNEVENNVYLFNGNVITVVGTLTDGAQIGVNSVGEVITGFTQGGDPSGFFIPDDEENDCIYITDTTLGNVYLGTHSGEDDGDCTTAVICGCGHEITAAQASHDFASEWSYDNVQHWHNCQREGCTQTDTKIDHIYDENGECECGITAMFTVTVSGNTTYHHLITAAFDAANAASAEATVKMLESAEISESLSVAENKEIILDLNGYNLTGADECSYLIEVCGSATFTLQGTGVISGGTNGGVYVNGGSFIMESGTISGNTANFGGGVYVSSNSTFTMSGGTISGNIASYGGGVYVSSNGTFEMSGGTISQNKADMGGGVYVYSEVEEKPRPPKPDKPEGPPVEAEDYSLYSVRSTSGMFIWGNPTIAGNISADQSANNVFLYNEKITVADTLTEGAQIGIYNTGEVATGFTQTNPSAFFIPDDSSNNCIYVNDGTVIIGTHDMADEWLHDGDTHWHECNNGCGKKAGEAAHVWGEGETTKPTCTEKGEKRYTCVCGETKTEVLGALGHDFTGDYITDAEGHWHICQRENCTVTDTKENHSGGTATCIAKVQCSVCGASYGEFGEHAFEKVEKKDPTCTEDGWEEYEICSLCGYSTKVELPALGHNLTHNPENEPTKDKDGNTEYWECEDCHKYFADAEGKTEITDKSSVIIPKTANDNLDIWLIIIIILCVIIAAEIAFIIYRKTRKNDGKEKKI